MNLLGPIAALAAMTTLEGCCKPNCPEFVREVEGSDAWSPSCTAVLEEWGRINPAGDGAASLMGDTFLMCPYETEGSLASVRCPRAPECSQSSHYIDPPLSEANRMPSSELDDMFLFDPATADGADACTEVFASGAFGAAMQRIAPLEIAQIRERWHNASLEPTDEARSMARVLSSIPNWTFCDSRKLIPGSGQVYAEYHVADGGDIVLFNGACTAARVYGSSLVRLSAGHRFWLVVGHEVGHAIDAATGDIHLDGQERRASIYGMFIAECFALRIRHLLSTFQSENEVDACEQEEDVGRCRRIDELRRAALTCFSQRNESILAGLREVRTTLETADADLDDEWREVMACGDASWRP